MGDDKNKRIDFVDLTKGVCIILVVMAHIGGAFEKLDYHSMIASFRMPLYFFISGIFFKSYEGLFGFFIRKINKLIIPFLFFYLSAFFLKYIVWKIAPGVFQLPVSWTELLVVFHDHALIKFNPPIWFLLALFNCNILFYLVHSLRNRRLGLMFALTLLIGTAGFYMGKHQIELPLYMDVAMSALPFYVAGFWIRRYNFFLFPHRFDKLIPLCILAALAVMYFTATFVGMRTNNYAGNIFQFWASAFAGIFMIMLFCKKFKKLPVISYMGRYSVITLGIHAPLLHFEYPVVSRFIHNEWGQAIALLLLTLTVLAFALFDCGNVGIIVCVLMVTAHITLLAELFPGIVLPGLYATLSAIAGRAYGDEIGAALRVLVGYGVAIAALIALMAARVHHMDLRFEGRE